MSEERKIILNMLAEGKIDAEQASELLNALEEQLREEWILQGYGSESPAGRSEGRAAGGEPPAGEGTAPQGGGEYSGEADPGKAGWSAEGVGRRAQELASKVGASMEEHVQNIPHFVQGVLSRMNVGAVGDLFGPAYVFIDEDTVEFHDSDEPVSIDVTGFNGEVQLETWAKAYCRYKITKRVYHRDDDEARKTAEGLVAVTAHAAGFTMASHQPEARRAEVNVEVWLPADRTYAVKVRTANGRVAVRRAKGTRFDVTTANGRIEIDDVDVTDMDLATSNGLIKASGRMERLKAVSSNGRLSVRLREPAHPRCTMDLATANAKITVEVPSDAAVAVDAATGMGGVTIDLPRLIIDEQQELVPGRKPRAVKARTRGETEASAQIAIRARTSNRSIAVMAAGYGD